MRPILALCLGILTFDVCADESAKRWERQIAAFEKEALHKAPPKDAILFVGSSSIRGWDLKKYFPKMATINRGFGGSQLSDAVHFAARIVIPHRPKAIVVYAGDNDINSGETAQQVANDYVQFVRKIRSSLPKTRIFYIAIKPSIKRWNLVGEMRKANRMISRVASQDPLQDFVDIDTPMIGDDGRPRKELFAADGLHLNHAGYLLWSKLTLEAMNRKPLQPTVKQE